jgi:hypothetical protein
MVDEKVLNMIASRTIPTIGPSLRPGRTAARLGRFTQDSSKRDTTGAKTRAASFGWAVSSCWANSAMNGARPLGGLALGGPADPVVLHHEAVQALEGVVLLRASCSAQVPGRRLDRLLEQGQEELVLPAEVLVEAVQRLARALHHFLDGEFLARAWN